MLAVFSLTVVHFASRLGGFALVAQPGGDGVGRRLLVGRGQARTVGCLSVRAVRRSRWSCRIPRCRAPLDSRFAGFCCFVGVRVSDCAIGRDDGPRLANDVPFTVSCPFYGLLPLRPCAPFSVNPEDRSRLLCLHPLLRH